MNDAVCLTVLTDDLLAGVTGGGSIDVKVDGNEAMRDVGGGLARLFGCAMGAVDLREFGNCILTGKLGNVPPVTAPQTSTPAK